MLHALVFILGLLLILATLLDGFETILLPRRVNHRFRYARLYYQSTWSVWRAIATKAFDGKWREAMLSAFGPLSLLGLFGSWVFVLIVGFAILHWSLGTPLLDGNSATPRHFTTDLYFSGTTGLSVGLGDVTPRPGVARLLTVIEGGMGFGFLAIIISYLPVLYGAFSRREWIISTLDARAGSPPAAGTFVLRLGGDPQTNACESTLREWEQWCVELLESHISFPVLGYYRSQHGNQSWLATLATVLDSCALLLTTVPMNDTHAAQFAFAIARHSAVDIALIFSIRPINPREDRLPPPARNRLYAQLREIGRGLDESSQAEARLTELRQMYEPFLQALSDHFLLALPKVVGTESAADNWQRSAWMPRTPGIGNLPPGKSSGDHFD